MFVHYYTPDDTLDDTPDSTGTSPLLALADDEVHRLDHHEVILAANQYGKAENRVGRITRDNPRHEIEDLNVTSQLRGDFAAAHLEGDNSHVVATDTQKNTIFAYAVDGVGSPEAFLLRLAEHFTGDFD